MNIDGMSNNSFNISPFARQGRIRNPFMRRWQPPANAMETFSPHTYQSGPPIPQGPMGPYSGMMAHPGPELLFNHVVGGVNGFNPNKSQMPFSQQGGQTIGHMGSGSFSRDMNLNYVTKDMKPQGLAYSGYSPNIGFDNPKRLEEKQKYSAGPKFKRAFGTQQNDFMHEPTPSDILGDKLTLLPEKRTTGLPIDASYNPNPVLGKYSTSGMLQ